MYHSPEKIRVRVRVRELQIIRSLSTVKSSKSPGSGRRASSRLRFWPQPPPIIIPLPCVLGRADRPARRC